MDLHDLWCLLVGCCDVYFDCFGDDCDGFVLVVLYFRLVVGVLVLGWCGYYLCAFGWVFVVCLVFSCGLCLCCLWAVSLLVVGLLSVGFVVVL